MITVSIEGLAALRVKVEGRIARMNAMQPGLLRAGASVLKAAQQRIDAGGPGWAPNVSGTPLLHATGRLFGSLQVGADGNVSDSDNSHVTVGTNVQVGGWNLGRLMQDGTGIYGPGGAPITPNAAAALSFVIRGRRVTVRSVKGSPPRPFLYIDDDVATNVRQILGTWIGDGDS